MINPLKLFNKQKNHYATFAFSYEMSHDENVKKSAEVTRDFVAKYFA